MSVFLGVLQWTLGKEPAGSASGWGANLGHPDGVLGLLGCVGTRSLLPGNHVRCGDFCRRSLVFRPLGRNGTGSVHSGGGGAGSYYLPSPLSFSPGRRVGRDAAQRPRAVSHICVLLSHCLLPPARVQSPALPITYAASGSHAAAQAPASSQFCPLLSVSMGTTSVSPGFSHWTVVTASPLLLPSNLFPGQQLEG